MPKVSVIVPIYGVEQYIERCARALFEQTLDDIEYVFVNDCTRDRSMHILRAIIEEYPNRKKQVVIINHMSNQGLPSARKTGILAATGEYVIHCDSDDWPDINLYSAMYEKAKEFDCDVVVCDRNETDGEHAIRYKGLLSNNRDAFILDMFYIRVGWQVWNKMFRRTVYDNYIIYPVKGMGEDMALMIQLVFRCKSICYVKSSAYNYFSNMNSMVRLKTKESCLKQFVDMCDNISVLENFLKEERMYETYKKEIEYLQFKTKCMLFPLLGDKCAYRKFSDSFPLSDYSVLLNHRVNLKERFLALLCALGLFPMPRNKYEYLLK